MVMVDKKRIKAEIKQEMLEKEVELYMDKASEIDTDGTHDFLLANKYLLKGAKKLKKALKHYQKHVSKYYNMYDEEDK